ncbi:ABC-F family ATP-binding cassette domain-containing protein [Streptacidiphilus monticola]|uniref:ABC-F family ATP-binding cassette domain-containing protein n=1 Tax=Streptacidiphilus monticola TaxID=2161674 RepID=A0ABW1FZ16_9ACTN
MHPSSSPSVSLSAVGLGYSWPGGQRLFHGLDLSLGPGRTGLIGANGSGKSTLLQLLAGVRVPEAGTVTVRGRVGYLPQDLVLAAGTPVDAALGIDVTRRALHAIERGEATEANFAAVGEDWDVEERARAALDRVGLAAVGLDRQVGELSGGETVLLGLVGQLLRRPDVLLLDEPSNNLDTAARGRLYEAVAEFRGALVVVSHDRELLERMDRTAELRDGQLRLFGGPFSVYEALVAQEQEAAERTVRVAEADLKRQRRELVDTQVKLARRRRYADKQQGSMPKIMANALRNRAEQSAGRLQTEHREKVAEARERLSAAELAVREDDVIRVDLDATAVPEGRTVLSLRGLRTRFAAPDLVFDADLRGPERVALTGPNGSGKTTLLRTLAGELEPEEGTMDVAVPLRYLPQRLDFLDDALSILANVRRFAPQATDQQIRSRLARFLFRGARVEQTVGTLSGGERFRAALAALMLAEPAPQLLLLDEPTNNLDLSGVRQLASALANYRGALVVVSHDQRFLEEIGVSRSWTTSTPEP